MRHSYSREINFLTFLFTILPIFYYLKFLWRLHDYKALFYILLTRWIFSSYSAIFWYFFSINIRLWNKWTLIFYQLMYWFHMNFRYKCFYTPNVKTQESLHVESFKRLLISVDICYLYLCCALPKQKNAYKP